MARVAGVFDPGYDWLKVIRVDASSEGEAQSLAQGEASKMGWSIIDSKEIPTGQFRFLCSKGQGSKPNPHW